MAVEALVTCIFKKIFVDMEKSSWDPELYQYMNLMNGRRLMIPYHVTFKRMVIVDTYVKTWLNFGLYYKDGH